MPDDGDRERIYREVTPDRSRVLHFLALRYSRSEIAAETGLAPATVRNHIEHMEEVTKLGQKGLRDFWEECEADFLRWHLCNAGSKPGDLVP
jgi:predicted transcriptional regulator